ncbi:MAG: glycoside hydrolase family 127 protein [Bacteroidaceae bacterium]|nr:glycoside hydrolase family 127 protein [Bacteroidaceae bacterium]
MKRILFPLVSAVCVLCLHAENYPITPVPFTQVKIAPSTFWGQRLTASREVTVPLAFSKCEETGRYRNFEIAADQLAGKDTRDVKVGGYSFDDTDVYKTIEGCSYLLQTFPDLKLTISVPDSKNGKGWQRTVVAKAYMDSVLAIVKTAQEKDGYLYTSRTMNPAHPHDWAGKERWEKVEDLSHEFYNLGHMVEGAIAHYQATGETTFLNIARDYADCVMREIGEGEGQMVRVPGHQIAEMALAKLSIVTGEKKYLDMAKFFLDKRGYTSRTDAYSQAHLPVVQQSEAVGHAVRAAYMYSGMADVAALTGDTSYVNAIDRIWENIVSRKMYITGGIGSTSSGEAFGRNWELPNMSAYCETCAAIGNVYVNHRLFLLHGESKYYDVLERSLYNGVISGVSLDGGAFFYPNPLESMGQHQRQPWFGCACCPSNICRFIPSIPGYVYQNKGRSLYVNLFMGNTADVMVNGRKYVLKQETQYPWDGDITLSVEKGSGQFAMNIRIPGWVRGSVVPSELYEYADGKTLSWSLSVNGKPLQVKVNDFGYAVIDRKWKKGDKVQIHFDMEPRLVKADEHVEADRGRVSVERGPLVYCAEWPDNDFDLGGILLNQKPQFTVMPSSVLTTKDDQTYNFTGLWTRAQLLNFDETGRLTARDVRLRLIPYYAWNHRGAGRMMVWLPQQLRATTPAMPPSLASKSRLTASVTTPALGSVNDRLLPKNAEDKSVPYYHWWPKQATTEWLQYDLPSRTKISSASVYWYDDQPWGGCAVPASWRILYRQNGGEWQAVDASAADYGVRRGALNTVRFTPVDADAVRLEVVLPESKSSGLFEWEIE